MRNKLFFENRKKITAEFLSSYIPETCGLYTLPGYSELDVAHRLVEFVTAGKMIRSGLAALLYKLYSAPDIMKPENGAAGLIADNGAKIADVVKAGASLELFHSALLVHDDIMDRDLTRRGNPTLFYQYARWAETSELKDPYHIGEALGICAGDIFFFLAMDLLNHLQPEYRWKIISLCLKEMYNVALGQMYDVAWGAGSAMIDADNIIELYKNKTGRYTFSLPLQIGAILAGASDGDCRSLEKAGELLGIIFQVKDDELNLFGSQEITGKPIGSDIKEGKKTLAFRILCDQADETEKQRLASIIGNPLVAENDIAWVKKLLHERGCVSRISMMMDDMKSQVMHLLNSLHPVNPEALAVFREFIDYNLTREK